MQQLTLLYYDSYFLKNFPEPSVSYLFVSYQNGASIGRTRIYWRFEKIRNQIPDWIKWWTSVYKCTIWLCLVLSSIKISIWYTEGTSTFRRSMQSKCWFDASFFKVIFHVKNIFFYFQKSESRWKWQTGLPFLPCYRECSN